MNRQHVFCALGSILVFAMLLIGSVPGYAQEIYGGVGFEPPPEDGTTWEASRIVLHYVTTTEADIYMTITDPDGYVVGQGYWQESYSAPVGEHGIIIIPDKLGAYWFHAEMVAWPGRELLDTADYVFEVTREGIRSQGQQYLPIGKKMNVQ